MGKEVGNEQLFEFMTKIYGEMQEGFNKVRQDMVRIENKMDTNHEALYDGYKLTYEKLAGLEEKVDEIDKKVERQDVEIRVIRGAK